MYQKKTEQDVDKNKTLALDLFQKGLKERALIVLKRKKYMEEILSRTDKQLETLETLVSDIEFTQIEVSVVEGLRVGTEALKQLNKLMNVDDIQQMMEDNAEAAEKQREISQILQQSSERFDDSELTKELEDIIESQRQPEKSVEDVIEELPSPPEELPAGQAIGDATGNEAEVEAEAEASKLDNLPEVEQSKREDKPKAKHRETRQLEPAQ